MKHLRSFDTAQAFNQAESGFTYPTVSTIDATSDVKYMDTMKYYASRPFTVVASTGTFVKNSAATWTTTGTNGVPSNWTIETASA